MPRPTKFRRPTVRLSLRIPDDLYKRLDARARSEDLYLTDVVMKALRAFLPERRP